MGDFGTGSVSRQFCCNSIDKSSVLDVALHRSMPQGDEAPSPRPLRSIASRRVRVDQSSPQGDQRVARAVLGAAVASRKGLQDDESSSSGSDNVDNDADRGVLFPTENWPLLLKAEPAPALACMALLRARFP